MKKSGYFAVIGIAVSIFFLFLTLRNVNFSEIYQNLKRTDFRFIILAVITYLSAFIFRGLRLKAIFQSVNKCKLSDMFFITNIAFFANNVLPLRMGELIGAYVLAKKHDTSKSSSLAVIVVSRIFDGISLILFASGITMLLWLKKELSGVSLAYMKSTFPVILAIFISAFAFIVCLLKWRDFTVKLAGKLLFFVPRPLLDKVISLMDSFICGLKVFHSFSGVLVTLLFSLLVWSMEGMTFYIISLSMGLSLPIYKIAFAMIVLAFGIILPSSPGFVGVYEYFCVLGLSIFGIGKDVAVSFSLLVHSLQFFCIIALGLISLSKENVSLLDARKNA